MFGQNRSSAQISGKHKMLSLLDNEGERHGWHQGAGTKGLVLRIRTCIGKNTNNYFLV